MHVMVHARFAVCANWATIVRRELVSEQRRSSYLHISRGRRLARQAAAF